MIEVEIKQVDGVVWVGYGSVECVVLAYICYKRL